MQQQQYVLNVEEGEEKEKKGKKEEEEGGESEWYEWRGGICDDEDIAISALILLGPIV